MADKRTTILIDENTLLKVKLHCINNGISIKDFLTEAINEKLNK